jgi:hypothetical protein
MAKENRVEGLLKGIALNLDNVDLRLGRGKKDGSVDTLAARVRAALLGVPHAPALTDAERASIVTWLDAHLKGKTTTEPALRGACSAAIKAFETGASRQTSPTMQVTSEAIARAMHSAVTLRKTRIAARANRPAKKRGAAKK